VLPAVPELPPLPVDPPFPAIATAPPRGVLPPFPPQPASNPAIMPLANIPKIAALFASLIIANLLMSGTGSPILPQLYAAGEACGENSHRLDERV
jgi:hypothetical protein